MDSLLQTILLRCGTVVASIMLAACGSYEFSVNERVVFTPEPLFGDFSLPDPALHACVQEHISRSSITSISELTDLNCSQAGIGNLDGLQLFSSLQGLKLSHNNISNVGPLISLQQLAELYLDHNNLIDVSDLATLTDLKILTLAGNSTLLCMAIPNQLRQQKLDLPEHCR